MPRTSEQNEAMRLATLEKVEGAAISLFARRGFAATNMRHIADEAGISIGSIYRHYATKDDLFATLVTRATHGLRAVSARIREDESPRVLITEFTTIFVADLVADGGSAEFFMIMNQAFVMPDRPAVVRSLEAEHTVLAEAFLAVIRRGQELGEFRSGDPGELATCYFAAIGGLAMLRFALEDRFVAPRPSALTASLIKETEND